MANRDNKIGKLKKQKVVKRESRKASKEMRKKSSLVSSYSVEATRGKATIKSKEVPAVRRSSRHSTSRYSRKRRSETSSSRASKLEKKNVSSSDNGDAAVGGEGSNASGQQGVSGIKGACETTAVASEDVDNGPDVVQNKANEKMTDEKLCKERHRRSNSDERLRWLLTECRMIEINANIRFNASLRHANCDKVIELMDAMDLLPITSLMLKRNPSVVITARKLRLYVGNYRQWNLTANQLRTFHTKAALVRAKACYLYNKYMWTFILPEDVLHKKQGVSVDAQQVAVPDTSNGASKVTQSVDRSNQKLKKNRVRKSQGTSKGAATRVVVPYVTRKVAAQGAPSGSRSNLKQKNNKLKKPKLGQESTVQESTQSKDVNTAKGKSSLQIKKNGGNDHELNTDIWGGRLRKKRENI